MYFFVINNESCLKRDKPATKKKSISNCNLTSTKVVHKDVVKALKCYYSKEVLISSDLKNKIIYKNLRKKIDFIIKVTVFDLQ